MTYQEFNIKYPKLNVLVNSWLGTTAKVPSHHFFPPKWLGEISWIRCCYFRPDFRRLDNGRLDLPLEGKRPGPDRQGAQPAEVQAGKLRHKILQHQNQHRYLSLKILLGRKGFVFFECCNFAMSNISRLLLTDLQTTIFCLKLGLFVHLAHICCLVSMFLGAVRM